MEHTNSQTEASEEKSKEASVVFTIYCHTHVDSGRRYIGLTKITMLQRWNQHLQNAKAKHGKGCRHFWNAIREYGKDAFFHEVLERCYSLEVANVAEESWIEFYDTRNPEKGFNLAKGGNHVPHPVKNPWERPEFRAANVGRNVHHLFTSQARVTQKASLTPEKRSAATKAAMARPDVQEKRAVFQKDPEYRGKISESLRRSLESPEARARMSEAAKLSSTSEVIIKRSAAIREAYKDPEVVARLSAASKANWAKPEMRAKQAARVVSNETKAKISIASTGKLHTKESIEYQRQLYLQRSSTCKFCDSKIEGKRTCISGHVSCFVCYDLHKKKLISFLRPGGNFV